MIKLSTGNIKLGKIMNTSVRPIYDCKNNVPCKKKCYAMKAWKQYPKTQAAWTHNSKKWRADYIKSADSVIDQIHAKRNNVDLFRIHVGGDFINQTHLLSWIYIAGCCPNTLFMAFTKRWDLNFNRRPTNMRVVWSMWPGEIDKAPKGQRAWVQDGTETRIPTDAFHCAGDCSICTYCWTGSYKDIVFNIH